MMKWKRHLTREANILSKYCIMQGIARGPQFIFSDWTGIHNQFWTWKSGETGIHFLSEEMQQYSDFVEQAVLQNPGLVSRYRNQCKKICDEVVEHIRALSQQVTSDIDSETLNALFLTYCGEYERLGETIIMTTENIEERITATLADKSLLSTVTATPELSFDAQEELQRLYLVDYGVQNYRELFNSQTPEQIKAMLPKYSGLQTRLEQHVQNFGWIPLNYEKDIWDLDFFIRLIQSYIQDTFDYHSRMKELENYTAYIEDKKSPLLVQLDSQTRIRADLLEARSFVRLYRANVFSLAFYVAFPLLKEMARRLYLPFSVIKYYTPPEISRALVQYQELEASLGQKRRQAFAMLIEHDSYSQYEGDEALGILQREYPEEKIVATAEIKGSCAYPGIVRGTVVVIFDAREMDKVKTGDILVCNATNPNLIIAMRKVGAIVTEEGGITSHAAIVSREMKKPCVIGTKIATKILKDGDLVEVNANSGIVRILEKGKTVN